MADFSTAASAGASGGDIAVFDVAERRMAWLDARQKQLAQNIANADTPDYHARDLQPFAVVLQNLNISPARTSPLHLAAFRAPPAGTAPTIAELAPDGNNVGLEDEMTKIAQDDSAQQLVGNLWKTYMGMFMTALGKAG